MKKAVLKLVTAVSLAIFALLACNNGEQKDTAFADKNPLHAEVDSLNDIAWNLMDSTEKALSYLEIALKKAEDAGYQKGIGDIYNAMGVAYYHDNQYEKAFEYYEICKEVRKKMGDDSGTGKTLNNIGLTLLQQGKYDEALKACFEALSIFEKLQDTLWISSTYNNIGLVYVRQERYDKALEYYSKNLETKKALLDKDPVNIDYKKKIAIAYNNIGMVYTEKGDYDKALENYQLSLKEKMDIGDKRGMSVSYNNLAEVFKKQGDYKRAIGHYQKSLRIAEGLGDRKMIAFNRMNLGTIHKKRGAYDQAIKELRKSLLIARAIKNLDLEQKIYANLDMTYAAMGNFSKAHEFRGLYVEVRDTLLNIASSQQVAEAEARYETEKKERQIEVLNKNKELQETQLHKQRIVIWSAVGGILLLSLLVLLVLRSKKLLGRQKDAIEKQKDTIKKQKENLDDSISYAKHIQTNMVLPEEEVLESLPESFRLWRPRDVVSGDFPWFANGGVKKFIAAADCTGHGVPGAFVSTVCIDKLNDAIREGLANPGEILQFANKKIKQTLRQGEGEGSSRDGMDIALCAVERYNGEAKMQFAGANNPVWIVRNSGSESELEEIRGTKSGLGGYTPDDEVFETHSAILHNGDAFYIFSDGYADQFGGPKNRKLMKKRLKGFILSIQGLSMPEQKAFLEKSIEEWMYPDYEQVDDILVIGVRV